MYRYVSLQAACHPSPRPTGAAMIAAYRFHQIPAHSYSQSYKIIYYRAYEHLEEECPIQRAEKRWTA